MASLSLKHINKTYPNGFEAVKDFNLEIEDKEFIIFVGPSGCGKSTTLRMIAGLEDITSGELKIGDKVVNDVEPKDRDIAMVFQNYALYPHMTVYDNMAFGLKLRKVPKDQIDKMVREAAKILDLEPLLDRKPKALSGGQRQRVAMGRAIVRDPKVFLMDEPLSNLDAKLRGQMRIEISKLHQRLGTTIIYVTHDQTEAMTLGTRIVVMNAGIVQQVDTDGRNTANHDKCPRRHVFRNYFEEGKSAGADKSHHQQQPSPSTERLLEAETNGLSHGLHRHGNADVHRTDNQRQQHLLVIGSLTYLTHNHEFLQFGGYLQVKEAYTEEGSQYGTDDGRKYTQRNHQVHHAFHGLGHLPFQNEPECNQYQTVARISHTESKEEREEWRKYRCRVELGIFGHTVHFG